MRCEVLRPFQATNDEWLVPGTNETPHIVDTAGWRDANVARLIERRYLRIVPDVVIEGGIEGPLEEAGGYGEPLPDLVPGGASVPKRFEPRVRKSHR